jgi:hypothetical protein
MGIFGAVDHPQLKAGANGNETNLSFLQTALNFYP